MNREEIAAKKKAYREANKHKIAAYNKLYYQIHKEQEKARTKSYSNLSIGDKHHFCNEDISQIRNYELAKSDNFKSWQLHHILETHNSDGERRLVDLTTDELKALGTYYDRPAKELIYLKHADHCSLHHKGRHWKIVNGHRVWYS